MKKPVFQTQDIIKAKEAEINKQHVESLKQMQDELKRLLTATK